MTSFLVKKQPGGRLMIMDLFHNGRGRNLSLLEQTQILKMDLLSLPVMLSASPTACGHSECLNHHHGIPCSIASGKGTHFTIQEVQQWTHAYGINQSYRIFHYPEIAMYLKDEWLTNDSVTPPVLRYLKMIVLCFKSVYVLNRTIIQSEFMGPGVKGWKW